jgi:hypothetical protein
MSNQPRHNRLLTKLGSDQRLALGLFTLGILSRLPFRTHLLYHWDSVNFALAVEKFDMQLHQPHPPGFLLYVLLGRWATQLVGDVNAGYVWISVLCSGLGAAAIFYVGRELFGRKAGILTALLFLSSPVVWFHGEIALTYILEAFMVVVLILLWWLMLREVQSKWLVLGSIAMGLSGGFRLPVMVLLAPLYLFSLRKYSWKQILFALLLMVVCSLVWLAPSADQSGGLDRYFQATFTLTSFSAPVDQKTLNPVVLLFGQESATQSIGRLGMYMIYGLLGGFLPLGYLLLKRGPTWLKSVRRVVKDERAQVLALWLLPISIMWAPTVMASGHTLSFLPAFLLLAGWGLAILGNDLAKRLAGGASAVNALTVGIILVNLGFFLLAPPYLFGIRRVVFTTPGRLTIRHRDQYLSERIAYIEKNFAPSNTAVWMTGFDYRHPDFYLRDYTSLQYVESVSPWVDLPAEIQTLVVFSRELNKVAATYDEAEATVLPSGELIYTLSSPHYSRSSTVIRALEKPTLFSGER